MNNVHPFQRTIRFYAQTENPQEFFGKIFARTKSICELYASPALLVSWAATENHNQHPRHGPGRRPHQTYGEFIAVNELSFSIQPGEVMGLVGPNGAGKTTTLRCLSGIIPPTRGTVRVGGHDIVRDPLAAKKQLAFFTDEPRLFDYLTVWQHLNFVARIYQVRRLRAHRPRTAGGTGTRRQTGRVARRTVARHEAKTRHRLRPAAFAQGDLL